MNILVCISHVPDTTTKIQFDAAGKELNKAGVTFVVNPYDEFGLSRALEFKEKLNTGKVVVICVGNAETEATIRKALAVGADEAVRIDTENSDPFFIAKQIAEYAKGNFDLIMMGKESIDSNGGAVPGMVAEMLGIPFVSYCTSIDVAGGVATLKREIDGGVEVLESSLPLVLSAQKGLAEWRIPNMRGIMQARTKQIAVVKPVDCATHTNSIGYALPAAKSGCVYIDAKNVNELVDVLHQKGAL